MTPQRSLLPNLRHHLQSKNFVSEMHKRSLDLYVESGDEERAILVDLLAKLCKAPSNLSNNNIWTGRIAAVACVPS
ncbi:Hypothetical predicted protein [Cloeon dipterum]|uniref:Uncharacterized protein n=1 Tax=Cloeon dipterum TaxID=197152 RepID=A0A8S1E8S0_9INSE|nr:Hypothetical predicted protein [Cloeon dipterum]